MPAPNKTLYTQLAKLLFASKMIALPQNWSQPNDQFPDAFSPSERVTAPTSPLNLFREATLNKYHTDAARDIGEKFEDYIKGICEATCDGIGSWLEKASVAGVIINGPVGTLVPGNVVGPPLMPLILSGAPVGTPQELKYSMAIATAFGTAWMAWASGMSGVLMYPAFAAFPGPVAPPTPNIPVPVITLPSPGEALLSPAALKGAMIANFGDPTALHSMDLFDALSQAFAPGFAIFKSSTIMSNVLGTGPIPTFAPPYVPVGPVLGGVGNGAPGCLK
jgi:hypothetical protein